MTINAHFHNVFDRLPNHGCSLQTSCPYCRKSLTSLGPRHYLGFCPNCSCWLDANITAIKPNLPLSEREEQAYFVSSIGGLLAAAPTLTVAPNRINISVVIQRAIKELFDGNGKRFALALGLHHKTLYELRDGTQLPQIRTLLTLCRILGTTPLKLLTSDALALPITIADVDVTRQKTRPVRYRKFDRDATKARLDAILQSNQSPPPSLAEVAELLGYDPSFLSNHLPDECQRISHRYAAFLTQKADSDREHDREILRNYMIQLHEQGIFPSLRRIGRVVGGLLRNPELRTYYWSVRKQLGYSKVGRNG